MAINRIVRIDVETGSAKQNLDALRAKLKEIDELFKGLGSGSGTGANQNPIERQAASARNAASQLDKYAGTLDNVARKALQSANNLTQQERATLNYDTATRKLNKALSDGAIDQETYNKSLERAENRFNALSAAAQRGGSSLQAYEGYLSNSQRIMKELDSTTSILARTELQYDSIKRKLNQALERGAISASEYRDSLRTLDKQQQQAVENAKKADAAFRGSFGGAGATLGQLGLQAQDVAVQMQMGTSAAIIFAQQGSQILSAFGPMGAILGTVAAALGLMYTLMQDTTDKMADLVKKVNELSSVSIGAKNNVEGLSDSLGKLSETNKLLATAELSASFLKSASLMETAAKSVSNSVESITDNFFLGRFANMDKALDGLGITASDAAKQFETLGGAYIQARDLDDSTIALKNVKTGLESITKNFGLTGDSATLFTDSIRKIDANSTTEEINSASMALVSLAQEMLTSTTMTKEQRAALASIIPDAVRAGQAIIQLTEIQKQYRALQERINVDLEKFSSKKAIDISIIGGDDPSGALSLINTIIKRESELTKILKTNLDFTKDQLQERLDADIVSIISKEASELGNVNKARALINELQAKGIKLSEEQLAIIRGTYTGNILKEALKDMTAISEGEQDRLDKLNMSARAYDLAKIAAKQHAIIEKSGLDQNSMGWELLAKQARDAREAVNKYYDEIQKRQTEEAWDVTGLTALNNQIADIEKEFGTDSELAKQQKAMAYTSFFEGARDGIQKAIASGDWSALRQNLGNVIAGAVGQSISQSVTKSVTDSLSSSLGSSLGGLAGGAVGAAGGAIAGGLIQGILAGSKTEKTGSGYKLDINLGEIVGAQLSESFKRSSMLGSSSWTEFKDLSRAEFDSVANSLGDAGNEISRGAKDLGFSLESFTGTIENDNANIAESIDKYSDLVAGSAFAAIEKYQSVGESLSDTFLKLVSIGNTIDDAIKKTGRSFDDISQEFVSKTRKNLSTVYQSEIEQATEIENIVAAWEFSKRVGLESNQKAFDVFKELLDSPDISPNDIIVGLQSGSKNYLDALKKISEQTGYKFDFIYENAKRIDVGAVFSAISGFTTDLKEVSDRFNDVNSEAIQLYRDGILNTISAIEGFVGDSASNSAASRFSDLTDNFLNDYFTAEERLTITAKNAKEKFNEIASSYDIGGITLDSTPELIKEIILATTDPVQQAAMLSAAKAISEYNGTFQDSVDTRTKLENQFFNLTSDTSTIREKELDLLRKLPRAAENNLVALQKQIWAYQDSQVVLDERKGLEEELFNLTASENELLDKKRESLDISNRSLFDQIQLQKNINAVSDERKGLEEELFNLTASDTELLAKQRDALDESNRALFDQIQLIKRQRTEQERLNEITKNLESEYFSTMDSLLSSFSDIISDEKERIVKEYEDMFPDVSKQIDGVKDSIENLKGVSEAIKSALRSLKVESQGLDRARRASAVRALEGMVGGSDLNADTINKLAGVLSDVDLSQYSSIEEYMREQSRAITALSQLDLITEDQLTVEEKTLKALETYSTDQRDLMQSQLDMLDNQLKEAKKQSNWLKGINDQFTTLESITEALRTRAGIVVGDTSTVGATNADINFAIKQAISQFGTDENGALNQQGSRYLYNLANQLGISTESVNKQLAGSSAWVAEQGLSDTALQETPQKVTVSDNDIVWTINDAIERFGATDQAWMYLYNRAKDFGVSTSRIDKFLDGTIEWVSEQGLPQLSGSHKNGLDNVPYDNYVANLHKGEMVLTKPIAETVRGMATNQAGGSEVAYLIRELIATVKNDSYNTNRKLMDLKPIRDLLEQWHIEGQPPVRV